MKKNKTQLSGFGIVEIMVAIAIASLVVPGIAQMHVWYARNIENGVRKVQAAYIAQESIEAISYLRNKSWNTYINALTLGTTYYLDLVDNDWITTTTNPGAIDGVYTRTVVLGTVNRNDSTDNISETGTNDPYTRLVTVTVLWPEGDVTRELTLNSYLTNYLQN